MKILYATDGSSAAGAAARLLTNLFRRDDVAVTVATVTPSRSIDPDELLLQLDPIERRREDSTKIVEYAVGELEKAGFEAESLILEGPPGRELVKAAGGADFEAVVVGAGSHSWMGNKLLGSVSTRVLHEAATSVIVVHEASERAERGRVIAGVDGSEASQASVGLMAKLLDPQRCSVDVIGVVHLQLPTVAPMPMGTFAPDDRTLQQEEKVLRGYADDHVAAAVATLHDAGFEVASEVKLGSPTATLLDHARATDADLVVVGSRGLGALGRTFLGSVSDQITRLAPATMVVKADTTS